VEHYLMHVKVVRIDDVQLLAHKYKYKHK
jgi:hypothetical protein